MRAAAAATSESPWKFLRRLVAGVPSLTMPASTTARRPGERTTQNAVLTDVALTARRRGERFDFSSRVSAGYGLDMLADGPGDQSRVTTMFAEVRDREIDWTLRGGRQSGGLGGLLGTFDGL